MSVVPKFYTYSVSERLRLLLEMGLINDVDHDALMNGRSVLTVDEADKLIENVVGVFGQPYALGLGFLINGQDYVVPMVVEEPSIVAAVSSAAKVVRGAGGFVCSADESLLSGQVQIIEVSHPARAKAALLERRKEIVDLANSLHPKMVARGGGAQDIEVVVHPMAHGRDMVVLHLLVDTCDAMGANLVNTMCEGVAPLVEKISGGRVFLRILSNLTDRAIVSAQMRCPPELLAGRGFSGEEVRDRIILAGEFAAVDPYRAATHNKGIMNGIDAVAIATGNDWRAIEAAAHAYAGRGPSYTSLSRWSVGPEGELLGELDIPMKVGIVGGQIDTNPAVGLSHRILKVKSARELAQVMAAVGLAQNFAALRALGTEGIQRGHMTLHARSCAVAAGAGPDVFDSVVERLIESGDIKTWKAEEILSQLAEEKTAVGGSRAAARLERRAAYAAGHGKVILLGEHAVVHGAHAIAAPIPLAIQARAEAGDTPGTKLLIPRWGVEAMLRPDAEAENALEKCLEVVLNGLGLREAELMVEVFPQVPRAMGLGGSASLAVAIIRSLVRYSEHDADDAMVNVLAYECEKIAHGTPSGVDNTLATYGRFILFKKGDPPLMEDIRVPKAIPMVIGISGVESLTARTVARVRQGHEESPQLYQGIFDDIDGLTRSAVDAIEAYDLVRLGKLMDICHGYLNALKVSTWELEELVGLARGAGALGAKLTGGGGGGSIVALCPDDGGQVSEAVASAIRSGGYRAIITEIG